MNKTLRLNPYSTRIISVDSDIRIYTLFKIRHTRTRSPFLFLEKTCSMYPQSISTNYDNFVAVVVKDIRCGGLMSQGHTMSFKLQWLPIYILKTNKT